MLINKINFTQSELNGGRTIKDVADTEISEGSLYTKYYRTSSVQVANNSGAEIHFNIFTEDEYNAWVSNSSVSELIPLADSDSISLSSLQGRLAKAVCSGTTGHTDSINIICIQETP